MEKSKKSVDYGTPNSQKLANHSFTVNKEGCNNCKCL